MPTHHACHACGHDLTRARAAWDRVENLPVVVCPGCRAAVVRRRDPGVAGYRAGRRAVRALLLIVVQGVMVAGLTAGAAALIITAGTLAAEEYGRNPLRVLVLEPSLLRPDRLGPDLAVWTILLLIVALTAGAWTRSALAHLHGWGVWTVWVGAVAAIATLPGWLYLGSGLLPDPPRPRWGSVQAARAMAEHLTMAFLFAAFFAIGMPLGRPLRSAWEAGLRARRTALRRRRRTLRENR